MSRSVRPLLELISFFGTDPARLFDATAAADTSQAAQDLAALFAKPDRTEQDNADMDKAALAVLAATADWAKARMPLVQRSAIAGQPRQMVVNRIRMLTELDEFQKQFPYRVAGGYSNRLPNLQYQQACHDSGRYEEDPFEHKPPSQKPQASSIDFPVFSTTFLLRLRFRGWALAQLATDPDPSEDEAGCMGSTMLHPADGDRKFNQAIAWQPNDPATQILREPRGKLPPVGVNCCEIALLAAAGDADVGYVPLANTQPPGVLQGGPVQEELAVKGVQPVVTMTIAELLGEDRKIYVDLLPKNGIPPIYCGLNHVVWQDGEPVDPFVLQMTVDPPPDPVGPGVTTGPQPEPPPPQASPLLLFQREVYSRDQTMLEMSPLQRLLSSRGPCGFTGVSNFPAWALAPADRQAVLNPHNYISARANALADALAGASQPGPGTPESNDFAVSLAERMGLLNTPKGPVLTWLKAALNYGHTLSGPATMGDGLDEVFSVFASKTGLQLGIPYSGARYAANSRWLVKYTCGAMDVDALSNAVYGELYVPLMVMAVPGPLLFEKQWTLPASLYSAVTEFACQFGTPFWGAYQVNGNVRTLQTGGITIVETLGPNPQPGAYSYTITGLTGSTSGQCSFSAPSGGAAATLTWSVSLSGCNASSAFGAMACLAQLAQQMDQALIEHFQPK